ncbi:hypothetical protein [Streptomyces viridochromogenes]|nr:hypothetical protein [Streptomyces viridochromogenes]
MPLFPLLRDWLTEVSRQHRGVREEGDASSPGWVRPDDWTDAGGDVDGGGGSDGGDGGDGGDY